MNEHLLKQAIEQDLKWCLEAPSLLAPHPTLWQPALLKNDSFQLLSSDLSKLINARKGKLGAYFEVLAGYLFKQHPDFELLAQNEIVYHGKTTLGELDLLVKQLSTNEVIHLELALKFYLWVPETESPHLAWIGTGLRDFLANKLARLYQHQLQLPHIAHTKDCWPCHLPFPDRYALWIPGRLYTPLNQPQPINCDDLFPQTPWRLNSKAEQSYWIEADKQPTPTLTLNKGDWLSPAIYTSDQSNIATLPAQITTKDSVLPLYVLPTQWQTKAQVAINTHIHRLI
jgi:hypothetical protein